MSLGPFDKLFAFLGGLTATVVYWLVHHSTLRRAPG